jgi:hypothetical protein
MPPHEGEYAGPPGASAIVNEGPYRHAAAQGQAQDDWAEGQGDEVRTFAQAVSRHPLPVLVGAFGIGFGIGILVTAALARPQKSWWERQLPDSFFDMASSLRHMPGDVASSLRHMPGDMASGLRRVPGMIAEHLPDALTRR